MAYSDNYAAAINQLFVQRVEESMISAAINIASEVNTTANHNNRVILAKAVLTNPQNYVQQFALAVAVNVPVTSVSAVTDAQIDTSVSGIWNGFAGVV